MQPEEVHILLVDDDEDALVLTQAMLEDVDSKGTKYLIDWSSTFEDALEQVKQDIHDVYLLDYRLGAKTGTDLLREMADLGNDTPVILMTEYGDYTVDVEAMHAGAVDFWNKSQLTGVMLERSIRYAMTRHNMERLERDRQVLQEATRSMEQVIGVIGHELRTPLTGLRAISELMVTDPPESEGDRNHFLESIHNEVLRMIDMVNDMLEAARMDSGAAYWKWTSVDLKSECQSAIDILIPAKDLKDIQIRSHIDPPDVAMKGDRDGIRRVILNLLTNAIKFTRQGVITVDVSEQQKDGSRWINLSVSDTGIGMSQEVMNQLGNAFALNTGVAGSIETRGVGLGLAVCKGIAAAHGGVIYVESTPKVGSTFSVIMEADRDGPAPLPHDLSIKQKVAC